jgi:chromosome segregation ATPase
MENALLGDAYIDELEAKGTELQNKAHDALKRAQEEAGRVRGELEEKRKLQEKTKELEEVADLAKAKEEELDMLAKSREEELSLERERANELESKAETAATELDSERQRRTAVEQQLRQAEATLLKLERALKMTKGDSSVAEEINLSVASLKSFFHEKIEEETMGSQKTGVIREGLVGNAQYKKFASALKPNTIGASDTAEAAQVGANNASE